MRILKRVKENNIVVGYMIDIGNNEVKFIERESAVNLQSLITNAVLLRDGSDYMGRDGVIIETIQNETRHSTIVHKKQEIAKVNNSSYTGDYYGQQFINVCRNLRKYARSGNVVVDMSSHKSNGGNNTHLFRLIEACGVSVRELVVGYLSVIQPYSLQLFQGKKDIDRRINIWVIDIGYGIKLVIKLNHSNENKPVIVSFHESNILHGRSSSVGGVDFSDKPCAVLIDNYSSSPKGFIVSYIVQRGFVRRVIRSRALGLSNDVAIVNYVDISTCFNCVLDNILSNLYTSYTESLIDINSFSMKKFNSSAISFMSWGFEIANNLCYLIDLYALCRDAEQRVALIDLALNVVLSLDSGTSYKLKLALGDRYDGSSNKLYLAVREKL